MDTLWLLRPSRAIGSRTLLLLRVIVLYLALVSLVCLRINFSYSSAAASIAKSALLFRPGLLRTRFAAEGLYLIFSIADDRTGDAGILLSFSSENPSPF